VDITPAGQVDYWEQFRPEHRGGTITADEVETNIRETYLESQPAIYDSFIRLLITTNFGSCIYDW